MPTCPVCNKVWENSWALKYNFGNDKLWVCSRKCEKKRKIKRGSYIYIWDRKRNRFIPEHRQIFEKLLRRKLLDKEIIHHRNGIKDDNRLENLQLLAMKNHSRGIETKHSEDIHRLLLRIKKLEIEKGIK